jgi:acyl dehydratase
MTLPDLAPGLELPSRTFGPVTMTDIVRYQGASGDMNPMHHDDALARTAGYPEAFGVGMLNAGYLATYCTDMFGTDTVRRFRTRFRGLVWRGGRRAGRPTLVCRRPRPDHPGAQPDYH